MGKHTHTQNNPNKQKTPPNQTNKHKLKNGNVFQQGKNFSHPLNSLFFFFFPPLRYIHEKYISLSSSIKIFIKLSFNVFLLPLWSSSQELMAQNQEQSADKWMMPGLKPKSSWTDCLTDWSNNLQSHHAGLQIAVLSGFDYYGYLAVVLKLEFGLQKPAVLPEPNWILLDGK